MRVTFTNGQPSAPVTVAGGFDFPTSVTVCVPARTQVSLPVGEDQDPVVGTLGESGAGQGPLVRHAGDRRLRLRALRARGRVPRSAGVARPAPESGGRWAVVALGAAALAGME